MVAPITPTEYSRYRYVELMLNRIQGDIGKACDIGCGVGNLLAAFKDHRIPSKGIDISDKSIAIARKRHLSCDIEIEKADIFSIDERFDLVYLMEVLEHIQDDGKLLAHLHDNVINKNGYIIVSVPAHTFLYSPFDRHMGHLRRYSRDGLKTILEENGFKVLVLWGYGSILFHLAANISIIGREKKSGDPDINLQNGTLESGIRDFPGFFRIFVSRVNIFHRMFFIIDYLFKNRNIGIEYCALCIKS